MTTKLIMLAHGSRSESWCSTFYTMTQGIREEYRNASLAFMELNSPSLQEATREAVENGAERIVVLPLFLAAGRHLKVDVPNMIRELIEELDVDITLSPPIGEHPALEKAVHEIVSDELKPWLRANLLDEES